MMLHENSTACACTFEGVLHENRVYAPRHPCPTHRIHIIYRYALLNASWSVVPGNETLAWMAKASAESGASRRDHGEARKTAGMWKG